MIGKAGLIAVVAITAAMGGRSIHPRTLYNQMYPVNSLKRHAFDLCHESDPAFVRAWREDRAACYDRMPYSISLALGMVQPTNDLAAFFAPADRVLGGSALPNADFGAWVSDARPPFLDWQAAGYRFGAGGESVPCPIAADVAGAVPLDVLAGRRDTIDGAALARLGLIPHGAHLPPPAAGTGANAAPGLALLDAADAADASAAPPPPATSGCSARI